MYIYLCVYIYKCTHLCIYVYQYVYIHIYVYTRTYVYLYIFIYIYTHIHVATCIYTYTYIYLCMYTYINLYINMCMYKYVYQWEYSYRRGRGHQSPPHQLPLGVLPYLTQSCMLLSFLPDPSSRSSTCVCVRVYTSDSRRLMTHILRCGTHEAVTIDVCTNP